MYGPHFVLLYGVVIVMTTVACWLLCMMQDPTENLPLPLVPTNLDPYEIAYLRGGESQVTQLVMFDLIGRGYLQVNKKSIERSPERPDEEKLTPIEREVFDWISFPCTAREIIYPYSLPTDIKQHCTVYEQKLQNQKLLYLPEWQAQAQQVGFTGGVIILGLGGYKLLAALANGHDNVGFLILMAIFSLGILWAIAFKSPPHQSHLGKSYLKQLQKVFAQLKQAKNSVSSIPDYDLLVALFGANALAGTEYDSYYQAFLIPTSSYTSSSSGDGCGGGFSSCGNSCSSSCGGGGGCGGGCGGCGG